MITVEYFNQVYCKLNGEPSDLQNVSSNFTFQVPDWFMKKKMSKKYWNWDGKKRLFNLKTKKFPVGLLPYLYDLCKKYGMGLDVDDKYLEKNTLTDDQFNEFVSSLNLTMEPRDYQADAVRKAIERKRIIAKSPTGSGKSLSVYMFTRWCLEHTKGKILIVVPTIGLVHQMATDFVDYGFTGKCHEIFSGAEKDGKERIYISTWQSLLPIIKNVELVNEKKEKGTKDIEPTYFHQFDSVVVDEADSIKNDDQKMKSLAKIMDHTINAQYRMGTTATIQKHELMEKVIEGYTGKIYTSTTMKALIDRGLLSEVAIKVVKINYPQDIAEQVNRLDWDQQQQFVENVANPRQSLIAQFATTLPENTLVLFRKIEHGQYLYDEVLRQSSKEVFYIDGGVNALDRNDIRKSLESQRGTILIASYGTMSMGVNIKNLHYIVFASSTKSHRRVLQSIGRGLRLHPTKERVVIFDFVDMFKYLNKHYEEREYIYISEEIKYSVKSIELTAWCEKNKIDFFEKS